MLKFYFGDITKIKGVHVIVNSANPEPGIIGNGVERAVYLSAGEDELLPLRAVHGTLKPGQAVVTSSCRLEKRTGAKYIIHTVVTPCFDGNNNEKKILTTCYANCMRQAVADKCRIIAFPLLGTGAYGFPVDTAFNIAVETIEEFLRHNSYLTVILSIINEEGKRLAEEYLKNNREAFIEQNNLEETENEYIRNHFDDWYADTEHEQIERAKEAYQDLCREKNMSREDFIQSHSNQMNFSGTLQFLMTKYKIDRKTLVTRSFCNETYVSKWLSGTKVPEAEYIYAIALAMHLSEDDLNSLLLSAGHSFGYGDLYWNVIWYLRNGKFNVEEYDRENRRNFGLFSNYRRSEEQINKDEKDLKKSKD